MTDAHLPNNHDEIVHLRDQLSEQLREKSAFSTTVYRDQPIIMTANQMKQFVPEPIRALRRMQKEQNVRGLSVAERFLAEGRMLEDCTDEYGGNEGFSQYYPTYEAMSDTQLRTYLTWRTKVRRGQVELTSTSYAYVYLYELINQIGVSDVQHGYDLLAWFAREYGALDPSILRYTRQWLDDYVIYYGLDAKLLRNTVGEGDEARLVLVGYQQHTDAELFDALEVLSGYKRDLFADAGGSNEEFQRVAARVYRRIAQHYDQKLSKSLSDTLLGRQNVILYVPFDRAVFADPLKARRDYTYTINEIDAIHRNGYRWVRIRHRYGSKIEKWTSDFLTTVDMVMAEILGGQAYETKPLTTRYMIKFMREETRLLVREKAEAERIRKEAEARAVYIDLSKLSAIRDAADATRDKLIVDDLDDAAVVSDMQDEVELIATIDELLSLAPDECAIVDTEHMFAFDARGSVDVGDRIAGEPASDAPSLFDEVEKSLIRTLLQGSSLREFEQQSGAMASLVIEGINAKMLDEIGDIVIDAAAEPPVIIDDYEDDLRGLI